MVTTRRQGKREYVAHLLRRSYREGGTVKKETVANLSHLPEEVIELIRGALRGQRFVAAEEALAVERSLPAGHVEAALVMASRLELGRLLDRQRSRERELCLAMIVQRVIGPGSKLAMSRAFSQSTLAEELSVADADEDELYRAMDWLLGRQERIERALARRQLGEGTLVLYDVSSSYFEGRCCPLAQLGYSRDRRPGTLQIVYGLLCAPNGCPVAVEVFEGALHDDKTLPAQLEKLRVRFKLKSVIVVSDRGMVTKANLERLRESEGAAWVTALKAPQVKKLVKDGALQLSLFDEPNLAEIASDDYPGERLVVCRNPLVAAERARKREDLVQATERALHEVEERVERGTLKGEAEIGLAVGAVWNRWRVRKHFAVEITASSLSFHRNQERIAAEAALDGIYVLRTSVPQTELLAPDVVRAYKQLKESSAPSARSRARSSCARSTTASKTASEHTSSSACSPTTSPGTCAKRSSRCSSTTSSRPRNPTPSPKRDAQRRPSRRRAANAPRQASPATHSPRCSTNSAPAPATPSGSTKAAPPSTN